MCTASIAFSFVTEAAQYLNRLLPLSFRGTFRVCVFPHGLTARALEPGWCVAMEEVAIEEVAAVPLVRGPAIHTRLPWILHICELPFAEEMCRHIPVLILNCICCNWDYVRLLPTCNQIWELYYFPIWEMCEPQLLRHPRQVAYVPHGPAIGD